MRLKLPIEFFSINDGIWVNQPGSLVKLTPSDTDLVHSLVEYISTFYPTAYAALQKEYAASKPNSPYYDYLIVARFIRCNFAIADDVPDIDKDLHARFEFVNCPIKSECKLNNVVCHPEFCHRLSRAEMRVCKLWFEGRSPRDIADELCLSQYTISNHIRNAYARLNVHSRAEFTKFALLNDLFKTNESQES